MDLSALHKILFEFKSRQKERGRILLSLNSWLVSLKSDFLKVIILIALRCCLLMISRLVLAA